MEALVNTICDIRKVLGSWLVVARTPGGDSIMITHKGTCEEALQKARWAEPS